jgi:hypothetical protein
VAGSIGADSGDGLELKEIAKKFGMGYIGVSRRVNEVAKWLLTFKRNFLSLGTAEVAMTFAGVTAFFNISLDRANQFHTWGLRASVVGALVTFLGLVFLYWGTRVRDREFDDRMAHLNLEAANARAETERLKKELGWRELSPEQQEIIHTALAKNPTQITIGWTSGDPESAMFARHLANTYIAAGSEISAFAPFVMLGAEEFGLNVSGSEENEIVVLVASLEAAHLGPITIKKSNRKPDGTKYVTHLFVGFRSPPTLGQPNPTVRP